MSNARRVMWLSTAYLALSAVAAAYALYKGNVSRADSEFSGLPLLLLALPWSLWLRAVQPRILESAFNNSVLVTTGYALVNGIILWMLERWIRRPR
jgi:hypothetical protein